MFTFSTFIKYKFRPATVLDKSDLARKAKRLGTPVVEKQLQKKIYIDIRGLLINITRYRDFTKKSFEKVGRHRSWPFMVTRDRHGRQNKEKRKK